MNGIDERFWGKVDTSGSCWLWNGAKSQKGYGRFCIDSYRIVRAHRMAWEIVNGPIPEGLYVCHKCDNPLCVKPSHLFVGTQKQNMVDMAKKERHGGNKLNEQMVKVIRKLHGAPGITDQWFSDLWGIGRRTIGKARTGQTWKHVD